MTTMTGEQHALQRLRDETESLERRIENLQAEQHAALVAFTASYCPFNKDDVLSLRVNGKLTNCAITRIEPDLHFYDDLVAFTLAVNVLTKDGRQSARYSGNKFTGDLRRTAYLKDGEWYITGQYAGDLYAAPHRQRQAKNKE